MLYPSLVGAICFSFGTILASQYMAKGKAYQLWWSLAIFMGAVGSLSYILSLASGHGVFFFRLYLFLGGLMPLYLGLGSVYLVASRLFSTVCLGLTLLGSMAGAYYFYTAPVNHIALAALSGGAGSGVITWLPVLILLGLYGGFGGLAVIGVAFYSVFQLMRKGASWGFVAGNVLIAAGTFIDAAAGAAATTFHQDGAFWLTMAGGWVVIFSGFLLTSATAAQFKARPQES